VIHLVGWNIPIVDQWIIQTAFLYESDGSLYVGDMVVGDQPTLLYRSFSWRHPIILVDADNQIIT